jgi:hypothetical protein
VSLPLTTVLNVLMDLKTPSQVAHVHLEPP